MLAGAGSGITLQGSERTGLYVEDENNFYSVVKQPSSAYLTSYYVEDENNVGSVQLRGTAHTSTTRYKGNGSYIYGRGDSVSVNKRGAQYSNALYIKNGDTYSRISVSLYYDGGSETYYKGNGSSGYLRGTSVQAIDWDGTLYESGGTHTYPLYTKVSKNLYAAGSAVTFPAYKKYDGKVYDAGQTAVIAPAEIETQSVTALTV